MKLAHEVQHLDNQDYSVRQPCLCALQTGSNELKENSENPVNFTQETTKVCMLIKKAEGLKNSSLIQRIQGQLKVFQLHKTPDC